MANTNNHQVFSAATAVLPILLHTSKSKSHMQNNQRIRAIYIALRRASRTLETENKSVVWQGFWPIYGARVPSAAFQSPLYICPITIGLFISLYDIEYDFLCWKILKNPSDTIYLAAGKLPGKHESVKRLCD